MIIGRDLISSLGLEIKGNDLSIKWNEAAIPWHNMDCTKEDIFIAEDFHSTKLEEHKIQLMKDILDAKYSKADLKKVAESAVHLNRIERDQLYKLLKTHKNLFDGTLGTFTGDPYDIKL